MHKLNYDLLTTTTAPPGLGYNPNENITYYGDYFTLLCC